MRHRPTPPPALLMTMHSWLLQHCRRHRRRLVAVGGQPLPPPPPKEEEDQGQRRLHTGHVARYQQVSAGFIRSCVAYFDTQRLTDAWLHPGAGRAGDKAGSPPQEDGGPRGSKRPALGDPARASAAGDSPPPPLAVVVSGPSMLRPLLASADRPRPGKSCLRTRRLVGVSLNFASSLHCTQTPVSPLPRRRQAAGRAVLSRAKPDSCIPATFSASVPCTQTLVSPPHHRRQAPGRAVLRSRAKPIRFAAAGTPTPSGGSVGVGGPAPLSIEDLTSIYQVVHRTEAGADPFEAVEIRHLRGPLEAYLSRQPERNLALTQQPRIESFSADAIVEFDLLVVPADSTRGIEEVKNRLNMQIPYHEVPSYRALALKLKELPSANGFTDELKKALTYLLEFEIRYIRGCANRWAGPSIIEDILLEDLGASGPC